MRTIDTEVLIVGSGAGGSVTAARLAEAGRSVLVAEGGPVYAPGAQGPVSLDEFPARHPHHAALPPPGNPGAAVAQVRGRGGGRCASGGGKENVHARGR